MTVQFSTAQILDTTSETIDILRNTRSGGRFWEPGCDAADQEFAALAFVAERLELDLAGIPTYRDQYGRVRGLSIKTQIVAISWVVADVKERIDYSDSIVHQALWVARRHSLGVSRDVRSLMVGMWAESIEDKFAAFRSEGMTA